MLVSHPSGPIPDLLPSALSGGVEVAALEEMFESSQVIAFEDTDADSSPSTPDIGGQLCAFCEIIAGRAPAKVVGRWETVIAIVPIGPAVEGHTLVIPDRHIARPEQDWDTAVDAARCVFDLAERWGGDYNLIGNVGPKAGQTVMHLHWHFLPRREGDGVAMPWAPGG